MKRITLESIPQATMPATKRFKSGVNTSNDHASIPELNGIKSGIRSYLIPFNSGK